ncbi:MAG: hypothetical protein ACXWVK_01655 [Rhodoplanes sp.]
MIKHRIASNPLGHRRFRFGAALIAALAFGFTASPAADCQGEFTPIAGNGSPFTQVHFFPKNGNEVIIAGVTETIPPGVGVISGGVIGTFDHASIDKVPGQALAGKTVYYVYVYMRDGVMTMDFSMTGHKEDETYGTQVHIGDPSRTLVGMVRTDENGRFVGSNRAQRTISWCNRGHTGLIQQLGGASTNSKNLAEVSENYRIEWLQWGINNTFRQGFTVPNIYVAGNVRNDKRGGYVQVAIAIDGVMCSHVMTYFQPYFWGDVGTVITAVIGANGTNEGYHYASFLMSTGGADGTAVMTSGAIYSSPFHS